MNPVFISKPNKCDGCPLEQIFTTGMPLRFKVANTCHKAQTDFDVKYGLNDLGQTVCKVYRRVKDVA